MLQFDLAYGSQTQRVSLPADRTRVLTERLPPAGSEPEGAVLHRALSEPIAAQALRERDLARGETVILVSDVTRPCPTARMLPLLLSELAAAGAQDKNLRIVVSLGSHRAQTDEEISRIVGQEVRQRIRCENLPTDDFVSLGQTRRGTPVRAYRPVVEADLRVYTGNVEYHYFAGYTGGAKAFLPGVCSPETLTANHGMMIDERAVAGKLQGNPVREDMEEAEGLLGPSFLYNVVLDGEKRVVEAVAGDVTLAHRQACRKVDELYRVPIAARADIVVASAGGLPKDINLYQTNKTLQNAAHAVRDGGIVVLLSECRDGLGQVCFGEWLTSGASPDELFRRLRAQFVIGAHVAVAINKVLKRGVRVFLVSSLDPLLVKEAKLEPFAIAQEALQRAQGQMGPDSSVLVMPHAGSTLPVAG